MTQIIVPGDFLDFDLPLGMFDLIVTSPPYNLKKDYGKDKDDRPVAAYMRWTDEWLSHAYTVAAPDGRLCVNMPLDVNEPRKWAFYSDFVLAAVDNDWHYHTTIVWNEGTISKRTAWGSWRSASAPYVTAPVEMVAVFYKGDTWKKQRKGQSDLTRKEFLEWTNGLWSFPGESAKRVGHPAPYPIELPRRLIKLYSYVGDAVLDPFCGSGSTLVAAEMLGRVGYGVELDPDWSVIERRFRRTKKGRRKAAPGVPEAPTASG